MKEATASQEASAPVASRRLTGRVSARHQEDLKRFVEILKEDSEYAYQRCGLSLLYSLPPSRLVEEMRKFGWEPQNAVDFFNLGAIQTQLGDHNAALELYEKAANADPLHWESRFNLALTHQELGNKDKAKEAMEECVRILEQKPELYNWESNDLERAREFLEGS